MNPRLRNFELNSREEQNHQEQQDRGCRSVLDIAFDHVINVVNNRVHVVGAATIGRRFAKQTNNGGVFFEASNKGSDHDIEDLRGKKRNRDVHHGFEFTRGVDFGSIVILLIDVLQAREENQNLKRQAVPNDVDAKGDHGAPLRGALVNPLRISEVEDEVDDTLIVEQNSEDHTNGDRVSDVRNEENRLEKLFKRRNRIETDGN